MGHEVDNSIYDSYGDRWYTAFDDPVALLRAETRVKLPWVQERVQRQFGLQGKLLDVGCGGGFLSNGLSAAGLQVTGLDIAADSLEVAKRWDKSGKVEYITGDAYLLPFADSTFDAVTSMDFLEHVDNPARSIQECARVLKPGGLFFYHTFNRNFLAGLLVIRAVEFLVKNTPKHMHVLRLFLKPGEVKAFCKQNGLEVQEVTGLRPRFSTIPLKSYFSGVVPASLEFQLTRSTLLSYMGCARKK
jgi:2-polyprenyl-6-hydroxyphenyl methylase/3-demethylubiquinone-9 3-methyltransferase